ncbi:hypothetical protein TRVA0_001S08878 [Trichomonascus vanleenenianus]|uniref:ZZ-type zinc finger protein n=1 Tax=Trichomonascus vanleenenianus TaxID=2268995 RepID=UPI003EC9EAA0
MNSAIKSTAIIILTLAGAVGIYEVYNHITAEDPRDERMKRRKRRLHLSGVGGQPDHGSRLPSVECAKPPYSEEAHKLYRILQRLGTDALLDRNSVHHNVSCTYCARSFKEILGVRYTCVQCGNVDLCEACERENMHPTSHPLYKIPYYFPTQLSPANLTRTVLPWQSKENQDYIRDHGQHETLPFRAMEWYKGQVDNKFSSAEIDALYDQYCHLVDAEVPSSWEYVDKEYGVITVKSLTQFLPTRYCGAQFDYLEKFFCKLYQYRGSGYVSFVSFARANYVITTAPNHKKVDAVLRLCPTDKTIRQHLQELYWSYNELSKNTFREALGMQELRQKGIQFDNNKREAFISDPVERELDTLLWEDRDEVDMGSMYDPISKAQRQESELDLLWDISFEEVLDGFSPKLLGQTGPVRVNKDNLVASKHFMSFCSCILEAGLI